MESKNFIGDANFYAICPNCQKPIPFQGVDIEYYKPIGAEVDKPLYSEQTELVNTDKNIVCPHCSEISKAKDCNFIINDF